MATIFDRNYFTMSAAAGGLYTGVNGRKKYLRKADLSFFMMTSHSVCQYDQVASIPPSIPPVPVPLFPEETELSLQIRSSWDIDGDKVPYLNEFLFIFYLWKMQLTWIYALSIFGPSSPPHHINFRTIIDDSASRNQKCATTTTSPASKQELPPPITSPSNPGSKQGREHRILVNLDNVSDDTKE